MPTFSIDAARKAASDGDHALSMANWLATLKFGVPAESERLIYEPEFIEVLSAVVKDDRLEPGSVDGYFNLARDLFPSSAKVLNSWGQYLFENGQLAEAEFKLSQCVALDPSFHLARLNLENVRSFGVDQWHFVMLNDRSRNTAYEKAINQMVKSIASDQITVLDMGCGSGLLSCLAARAGASKVLGLEESEVWSKVATEVTQNFLQANGCNKKCQIEVHSQHSSEFSLPEGDRSDLIVAELMDAGLYGEGIVPTLADASRRLLKPGGRVIPSSARFFLAPVESAELRNHHVWEYSIKNRRDNSIVQICSSSPSTSGLNQNQSEPDTTSSYNEPYSTAKLGYPGASLMGHDARECGRIKLKGWKYLADPQIVDSIDFENQHSLDDHIAGFVKQYRFPCTAEGCCDALVGWFEVELAEGVLMNTEPGSSMCWEQCIYPIYSNNRMFAIGDNVGVEVILKFDQIQCRIDSSIFVSKLSEISLDSPMKFYLRMDEEIVFHANKCRPYYQYFLDCVESLSGGCGHDINCLVVCSNPVLAVFLMDLLNSLDSVTLNFDPSGFSTAQLEALTRIAQSLGRNEVTFDFNEQRIGDFSGRFQSLIVDVMEHKTGFLNAGILEKVAYLTTALKINKVIPESIQVFGQIVSSDSYREQTSIIDDLHTLDVPLSRHVNLRHCRILPNVIVTSDSKRSLDDGHLNLSRPLLIGCFNLTDLGCQSKMNGSKDLLEFQKTLSFTADAPGSVDGLLVWIDSQPKTPMVYFDESGKKDSVSPIDADLTKFGNTQLDDNDSLGIGNVVAPSGMTSGCVHVLNRRKVTQCDVVMIDVIFCKSSLIVDFSEVGLEHGVAA